MFIRFEKCELKLDEIQKGDVSEASLQPHEKTVVRYVNDWVNNKESFSFHTSGSTGRPKNIKISRAKIEYSCRSTIEKLDPKGIFKSALLCINPEMIGGAMVVFRSLIFGLDLRVIKPSSTPLTDLEEDETYDLTSLVPLQFYQATQDQLRRFHTILVGGANLDEHEDSSPANIYSTFGMTETASHFALRKIGEPYFECVGDVQLMQNMEAKLQIKGTITDHKLLESNDIIEIISTNKFKWIGRGDFVINSGGLKIHPEKVESMLKNKIDRKFIVSSLPDKLLGNRLILILEGEKDNRTIDLSEIPKYERPKEVHFLKSFKMTDSGKIDRLKTARAFVLSKH